MLPLISSPIVPVCQLVRQWGYFKKRLAEKKEEASDQRGLKGIPACFHIQPCGKGKFPVNGVEKRHAMAHFGCRITVMPIQRFCYKTLYVNNVAMEIQGGIYGEW